MPPKQKAKQKVKQKQKQKQKQTQSVVVNIGKTNVTRASRSGRKRLTPSTQSYPPLPIIIQGQQQQPDYSSILTAMMQHQTRTLSQKEPIINNLTPTPTPSPTQTAEPQTPSQIPPQIQASPNQQLTQQQRRDLSSAAAERRAGNTASNFQAPPSSLASPQLPPPPSEASLSQSAVQASLSQSPVQATLIQDPVEGIAVRPGDNYYHETVVKGEPAVGGAAEEPPGGAVSSMKISKKKAAAEAAAEAAVAAKKAAKAADASKNQREEKTNFMKSIGMKLDKGEPLTQSEISKLMSNKTLAKKIKEKLISKGYDLFKVSN
tara:strand:+ start:1151 stop:2107 length:957 start_codon:yes stop_codon:yes gene_type:complete